MSLPLEAVNCAAPPVKPVSRRFQISIRAIMIATAVIAVIIGLVLAPIVAAIGLMIVHGLLLGFSIIAAISGRGWIRPFAIIFGLYLAGLAFALFNMHLPGPEVFAIVELFNLAIATFFAFCGAVFHSYLTKRHGYVPVPKLPFVRHWLANEPRTESGD